jgi:hypothetical protein
MRKCLANVLLMCMGALFVRRYARFLMKQGNEEDHKTGTKWLRRASENLRTKLSPTVTDQNRLGGYNR